MFLSTTSVVIMTIGSILTALFIILLLASGKYKEMVEPLDEKEFPAHELYTFGFLVIDLIKYDFNSKKGIEKKREAEIWYGSQFGPYYVRVIQAQKITLSVIIFLFGFIVYGLTCEISILGVFGMMAFAIYYYYDTLIHERLKKRSEELLREFPDMVGELALLTNAGMILREAWRNICDNGDGKLYEFMKEALIDMDNGMSEIDAYNKFGSNCMVPEIKKFTSILVQNMTKGNREFVDVLKSQSGEIWEMHKNHIRQLGEKAASNLLIPIMFMFVGILIMIIVPIFANI